MMEKTYQKPTFTSIPVSGCMSSMNPPVGPLHSLDLSEDTFPEDSLPRDDIKK